MREARSHPALFHRVFLSHLIVVLLCFTAAVILIDYLFAEGVTLFLLRSPIILVPALLALIGIVGLLALWTAGSTAVPLDRASSLLSQRDAAERLLELMPSAGTEEVARMINSVQHRLAQEESRVPQRPLFLRIDGYLNVRDCDIDTAARFGFTPEELRKRNLRGSCTGDNDVKALRAGIESLRKGSDPVVFTCHFHGAAGRVLQTACTLYTLTGEQFLLIGMAERRPV
ncbi:MAG: hypothetical protein IH600_08370 [Bacteroidetes bacterium]|nr:hypothetical protein [Bacteroidota bacterium]